MMILSKIQKVPFIGLLIAFLGTVSGVQAATGQGAVITTASNGTVNQLLVYSPNGTLVQTIPTQGAGGASGNSGGIATNGRLVAVVNFGSNNVSIFEQGAEGMAMTQLVPAVSSPLSVAFSSNHLYILGTTTVESHSIHGTSVTSAADGETGLLVADGSSAQVGVLPGELIITEKSNMIETVGLLHNGSVWGAPAEVANIPANVDTPFGLLTSGDQAYVTIAHANETSLVRNGAVITTTSSGTQNAPCWLALVGAYLYSSNSPSMSVSKYIAYGKNIVDEVPVAATFNGDPTDMASGEGLVAVVDSNGTVSHLSIFSVDGDGRLNLQNVETLANGANGVAVLRAE